MGLRTLVFCKKIIPKEEFLKWHFKFDDALKLNWDFEKDVLINELE